MEEQGRIYLVWVCSDSEVVAACTDHDQAEQIARDFCKREGYDYGSDVVVQELPLNQEFNMNAVATLNYFSQRK
jgi:hypothetical protein